MNDKKKLKALTKVGKDVIKELEKFSNPPYNDREAALFAQEIGEKSQKMGPIYKLKTKIEETFTLLEEAKNYIEQKKESLKYMKVKDKDGNETTVYNFGMAGAKKAVGTLLKLGLAKGKFMRNMTKKKGLPKLEPCKKPPSDISPEQEKNLIIQYALSCNEIQNINRMNTGIEIIKKWAGGEVMDSQMGKYPSDWKAYINDWAKRNNIEKSEFKDLLIEYWKDYEDTMIELRKVIGELNKKFDKSGNDETSLLKTISKKFNGLLNQIKNDKYHDRLNKIFIDKLKDLKENLKFNEKNTLNDFYDIFRSLKRGVLDTSMPEEKNFMYQFVKNKLEPFVSPISTEQSDPQPKQRSNEGSAPQQQQVPDAPQQQVPDAPQQQAQDAQQQQAVPGAPQQIPNDFGPRTNLVMNAIRKVARIMGDGGKKLIKFYDKLLYGGQRRTRKIRYRRSRNITRKIY